MNSRIDLLHLAKESILYSEDLTKISHDLLALSQNLKEQAEQLIQQNLLEGKEGIDLFSFKDFLEDADLLARKRLHDAEVLTLSSVKKRGEIFKEKEISLEESYLFGTELYEIVRKEKGLIILKMPMPLPRLSKRKDKRQHFGVWNGCTKNLVEEIRELFLRSIDAEDLKELQEKLITFLYVYPKDYPVMIDTDAHETKGIIDAFCKVIPFGDGALETTILQKTIEGMTEDPYCLVMIAGQNYLIENEKFIQDLILKSQNFTLENVKKIGG